MNMIITLKQLVELLTANAGVDTSIATRFVDELSRAVSAGLESDGRVEIDGLGIFSRDGLGDNEITFVPCEDIAAAVNAPFDMFEPEVLDDRYADEESAADRPEQSCMSFPEVRQPAPRIEPTADPNCNDGIPTNEKDMPDGTTVDPVEITISEQMDGQPASRQTQPLMTPHMQYTDDTPQHRCDDNDVSHRKRHGFGSYVIMMIGFVMLSFIIGTVAGYFAYPMMNNMLGTDYSPDTVRVDETVEVEPLDPDTPDAQDAVDAGPDDVIEPQPDETVREPATDITVTDTVKAGNSLAKIARNHYGKSDFWVYIYEANADKLDNPDNIASGTILVIPPASQYDINPDDPECVRRARAKAGEIYRRYR